jgi:hypothetical protein
MTPIWLTGTATNSAVYALSRASVFGMLAVVCAAFGTIATGLRVLAQVDCCPHAPDLEPARLVCRGCDWILCPDCRPEWQPQC